MKKLIQEVNTILKSKKRTISVAESCTGGLLSHKLTTISGSSSYFKLGLVAYSNEVKIKQLNISQNLLKNYGAVSEKVAILMAENVKNISNTDISLSTTGIAGPTGGTIEKPMGLVYIGISTKSGNKCQKFHFKGKRLENINSTVKAALLMLKEIL